MSDNFSNEIWSRTHYFHLWFIKKSEKYGDKPTALIESETGRLTYADYFKVRFIDNTPTP